MKQSLVILRSKDIQECFERIWTESFSAKVRKNDRFHPVFIGKRSDKRERAGPLKVGRSP